MSDLLVLRGQVTVYSISGCPHCKSAKHLLQEKHIPYLEINLDAYPERHEEMVAITGQQTVPQILINSTHIGGNLEIHHLEKEGKLDALLQIAVENEPDDSTPIPPTAGGKAEHNRFEVKCERSSHGDLIKAMREAGFGTRSVFAWLKVHSNAFSGREVVDWIVENGYAKDRQSAVCLANELVQQHVFHDIKRKSDSFEDSSRLYRFLHDEPLSALNVPADRDRRRNSVCAPRPATEVAQEIRSMILLLYDEYLSPDGRSVDYRAMANSKVFHQYAEKTEELQFVDVSALSREEKLAFFINIYNALVVHATAALGPPTSGWQRYWFFYTVAYVIGGMRYSLHDIENGILRCNRNPPYTWSVMFKKNDPRLAFAICPPDVRIHFALVCGAKSCPPIKTYKPETIEKSLAVATRSFVNDDNNCLVDVETRTVHLSQIFYWYRSDFGSDDVEILEYVCNFLSEDRCEQLRSLLKDKKHPPKLKYFKYNWDTNQK
eukprot:Rmarinus@m.5247